MTHATSTPKDFLSVLDFDADGSRALSAARGAAESRPLARHVRRRPRTSLNGRHVALLFEKPSLRTRTTFEIAVRELGGDIVAPQADVALHGRESVADVARNLERWVDAVVDPHVLAAECVEEFAAARQAPARHQRADRRGASVPGASRTS